jgi:hypothetical protein
MMLVDSCADDGDGEAVGYENVDEPVRLDAGYVGEQLWPGGDTDPLRRGLPIGIPRSVSEWVVATE